MDKLPNSILFDIINNLDVKSKLNLSILCKRFYQIVYDKLSWKYVYFDKIRVNKKSNYRNIIKILIGNHTTGLKFNLKSPHSRSDTWNKVSEDIDEIIELCRNLKYLSICHNVKAGEAFTSNVSMPVQMKNWPVTIECFELRTMPKFSCLRCLKDGKLSLLPNLKSLTIDNCSWFTVHDFHFLSPNYGLHHLKLINCFRLFENEPNEGSLFLKFPNIYYLELKMAGLTQNLFDQLRPSSVKYVSLTIDKKNDLSKEIFTFIVDKNHFHSNIPSIYKLKCNSEIVQNIGSLITKKSCEGLSIPFELELIFNELSEKNQFDIVETIGSTFKVKSTLIQQHLPENRKRKFSLLNG